MSETSKAPEASEIPLLSGDGACFSVLSEIACEWGLVNDLMEAENKIGSTVELDAIPLPNVDEKTLRKVIDYCERKREDPSGGWKRDYFAIPIEEQVLLTMAANYLHIDDLLDDVCRVIAEPMKGKTPEEIRKMFKIKNDLTEEEEEQIRRENAWVLDL